MGTSTDAYLFWGFSADYVCHWINIGREDVDSPPEDEDEYEEDVYLANGGDPNKKDDCQINYHCHADHAIPFVTVTESFTMAWRGDPKVIENLEVKPDWEEKLKLFCKIMGIKWQEPKWILASYWG